MITLKEFAKEAKATMAQSAPLLQRQEAIGTLLSELTRRDDLLNFAVPVGHSDATTSTFMLLRDGKMAVMIAGFAPHYSSPVHEHGNFWVVACGYRGADRWKMYERVDDGSKPGYSEVKYLNDHVVAPQKWAIMPPPPRAIHQHNNLSGGETLELLFSCTDPLSPNDRLIYDVDGNSCWPSGFKLSGIYGAENYPSTWRSRLNEAKVSFVQAMHSRVEGWQRPILDCAICMARSAMMGAAPRNSFVCSAA